MVEFFQRVYRRYEVSAIGFRPYKGTVYLVHFETKMHHAAHYLGWTVRDSVEERFKKHLSGQGARILRAANDRGIKYKIVATWEDKDRNFERTLKNQKNAWRLCPICRIKRLKQINANTNDEIIEEFIEKDPELQDLMTKLIDDEEEVTGGLESHKEKVKIKNGREIELSLQRWEVDTQRFEDDGSEVWLVRAKLGAKVVGFAEFYKDWGTVEWVHVEPEYQRLGVATALYDFIEKTFHTELSPSEGRMEDDGIEFWRKRNPRKIARRGY